MLASADVSLQRGTILGEARLPAAPKSVFDYLSAKDRERLQSFAAKAKEGNVLPGAPQATVPLPPPIEPATGEAPSDIPSLHPSVAKAAMSGFKPFAADPSKAARYDVFLQYHASPSPSTPYLARQPGQSAEEFTKELNDYAKAAMIFKPATGAMANRFRSAVLVDDKPKAVEGLHVPSSSTDYVTNVDELAAAEKEKEEQDPKKHAAKMGMYGKLTREATEWRPTRLLCKRFGVVDPYLNESAKTTNEEPAAAAPAGGMSFTPASAESAATTKPGTSASVDGPIRKALENIGLGEDETQGRDTLTYERPAMDIFKAIFASDDEDDGSSDEDAPPVASSAPAASTSDSKVAPSSPPIASTAMDVDDDVPVDPSSFRPTFVSRAERDGKRKDKDDGDKKGSYSPLRSY